MKRGVVVLSLSILLGGCSTQDFAEIAANANEPEAYNRTVRIFGTRLVEDERIDRDRYKISVLGNTVTSVERAVNLAKFHAAILARQRGSSHFALGKSELRITCTQGQISSTEVETIATLGDESLDAESLYVVSEVISDLESGMRNPQTTNQERQRIFIANQYSCSRQRFVSPANVRTNAELEARERTGEPARAATNLEE